MSVDYSIVPKGSIIISVSQGKTAKSCLRKNWLEKKAKMPVVFAASTTRGSILHGCVERWLLHTRQLKPNTEEYDNVVFPHEWYVKDEKGQRDEIDEEERKWVKDIVATAIESRNLLRHPNREVEWSFLEELLPAEDGKPAVWIVGYIDLAVDNDHIIDHKTCKNFRWTLNTDEKDAKKYIGYDVQLNIYAYYWAKYNERVNNVPLPSQVKLEHIQYGYEDPRVKSIRCNRSWDSVLNVLDDFKENAKRIRDSRSVTDYSEVESNENSCGAYGGCPFQAICGGMEELEDYKKRIEQSINDNKELQEARRRKKEVGNEKMNAILAGFGKKVEENTADLTPKEEPKVEPKKEEKSNKLADKQTKEEILAAMKKVEDNMKPMDIDPETIPAYQDMQKRLDDILDEEAKQRAAEAEAKRKAEAEAEAKAKAEAEEKAVKTEVVKTETTVKVGDVSITDATVITTTELAPTKDKKTSLRKGFVLLINASSNSYTNTSNLATIYAEVAEKVKESNPNLDAQQVHATVVASADQIAEKMLKGLCVQGAVMDTFVIELATALVPLAEIVVYGTQPN